MNVDDMIEAFEIAHEQMLDANINNSINIQVMKSLRYALTNAGMDRSYADQLIARSKIDVTDGCMDAAQLSRFLRAIEGIGRQFYLIFKNAGFNDQAIALMGDQLDISFKV